MAVAVAVGVILAVEHVGKRFGGVLAIGDASLAVAEGSITGLIGPNGAGKTTLFGIVAGFVAPTTGRVLFRGVEVTREAAHLRARRGIARTFQIVQPFAGLTVRENIAVGAHLRRRRRADALERAAEVAAQVGLATELDKPAGVLTVAGRKRLEVARALATEPALLLLDEVLAGLNPSEVAAVLPVLRALPGAGVTVLMTEHVLGAVMALCATVHVLAGGRIIAAGPPDTVVADPAVRDAYLGHRRVA